MKFLTTAAKVIGTLIFALILSGWFYNTEWTDALYADLHSGNKTLKILGTVILGIGAAGIVGFFSIFDLINGTRAKLGAKKDALEMIILISWFIFTAVGIGLIAGEW